MEQRNIANNHGRGGAPSRDPSAAVLKRNSSEWDLEALLTPDDLAPPAPVMINDSNNNPKPPPPCHTMPSLEDDLFYLRSGGCVPPNYGLVGNQHQEPVQNHLTDGRLTGRNVLWPENNITPKQSTISATLESQSSMCVGTPTSSHKPLVKDGHPPGATSCSEQSDDDSLEIEAGQCEQSTDPVDIKRMRRMVSNRESARRSRRRKQAHLADLESQVDQLRNENANLYQQLTDANKQFTDAATDNRVLKSDVEALRIKVKMAEDMVTRGSLCSLNHLFQGHTISPSPPLITQRSMCRATDCLDILGDGGSHGINNIPITGPVQGNIIHNVHANNNSMAVPRLNQNGGQPHGVTGGLDHLQNKISVDSPSCGSDIWAWESHATPISK